MWQCRHMPQDETASAIERFLTYLHTSASNYFAANTPITLARAPGRLDFMGGIADYSGSLVLEMPIAVATLAAVQFSDEPVITVCSTEASAIHVDPIVYLPLTALYEQGEPIDYSTAHRLLVADPQKAWAAYIIGVLVVLQREGYLHLDKGMRILLHCEVPIGKGVSSSAALEVAAMQAIKSLCKLDLNGRELAILCQKVENLIVGAPCGVMDQMSSACGEKDSLLALLCQPAELQGTVPLPEDVEIWGIDSGVRHAVVGADYASVRIGAFMGYRIIAELMGLHTVFDDDRHVTITDPYWQGYLANISPSRWETTYRKLIPETIEGATFLARYGGSTDRVTHIDPEQSYAVRQPTAHPIYEHHRVRLFRALLSHPGSATNNLALLGELMYQSHVSYSACGLGSHGTDRLVELVRQAGSAAQLYGAKITGGGSGGTVAVLACKGADEHIQRIVAQYEEETGLQTTILRGSSSGAVAWGSISIEHI